MYCKNCGRQMDNQAIVCTSCGVPVGKDSNYCQNCGEPANPMAQLCVKCGCSLSSGANQKSKLAAGLLGIFLGGLGIHRFYLGYTAIGVIQIIVTLITCGVGSIWGFIEGILIIAGTQSFSRDAQGVPLKD